MTHRLNDLSWERFRALVPASCDLAIVPVGTIEAHGAIPLGTDTIIPEALAVRLAPKWNALIAPSVAYGVTNSLLPYPGSTTVSSATFRAYLFEAAAGLVDTGFRRIVILNGHGGQSEEVADVVARLWNEKRAFAVAVEWWGFAEDATAEIYPGTVSGHAGVEETAMVLAVAPDLIDTERATAIRRFARRHGLRARPFPASIILDRPETKGEGAPVLDPSKAKAFFDRVVQAIDVSIGDVFAGWRELRP
ncbi:MAG TPA: creatininase family protein [Candidatus Polarisedimenticolaceae bacterium]|nr:creatininase family protein [Candidatus Polarisedimenticolaceae bacterium]